MAVSNLWCCVNYNYRVVASNSFGNVIRRGHKLMVQPVPVSPNLGTTSITDTDALANAMQGRAVREPYRLSPQKQIFFQVGTQNLARTQSLL